jgi:hypothetical protein
MTTEERQARRDAERAELTARIHEYAERVVADAPSLSPEQLDRVIRLLRGPSGGTGVGR